ncbi:ABC transporter permease [Agrobacterium sp. CR_3]|uniref:ABC transporter permease n=1 Tax=Agrobacterium sp. CR_3 TaxID=3055791 RepID=UPI0035BEC39C
MSMSRICLSAFVGLVLVWLVVPILIIIPMSFSSTRFLTFPPPSLSLRWYQAFFDNTAWMSALRVTFIVAFCSAVLSTITGTAAAYALNMSDSKWVRRIQVLLLLPVVIPIIITAVGVFLVYSQIGLLGTLSGLVLANVMLGLPYVITSVLVALRKFDPAQEMVARSLGMNRWRAFFAVTLPQIRAGVLSGALFAFISALDETVVAIFISGGQNQTLTKRMFTALRDEIDPTIAAISAMLTLVSIVTVILVSLARKERGVGEKGARA